MTGGHPTDRRWPEVAAVGGLLVALQLAFVSYYTGASTPTWDFYSGYLTDAHAWWANGSLVHPPEWLDYLWNGYPAAAAAQNSSFYLPVGLTEWLFGYTAHSAAVLQALHAGLGALGAHVLARSLGVRVGTGLFLAVMYFFGPGFFSGAQHVDYLRGWAWLPWLLLVASPMWPWTRPWAVPVAAVLGWQAAVGSYPGQLAALVYVGAAWVATWLAVETRARLRFAVSLGASLLIVGLLCLPKVRPFLLLAGGNPHDPDVMSFGVGEAAALFLPYWSTSMPNTASMASLYLPAGAVVLLAFTPWRDRVARPLIAMLLVAVVLGVPALPTYDLPWPGLDLSRFQMNDFRAAFFLAVTLLAGLGLERFVDRREPRLVRTLLAGAVLVGVTVALGALHPTRYWQLGVVVVVLGVLATAAAAWVLDHRAGRSPETVATALVVTAVLGAGVFITQSASVPWKVDRIDAETTHFGATIAELQASRTEPDEVRRAARSLPPATNGSDSPLMSTLGNAGAYSGSLASYGYLNRRYDSGVSEIRAAYETPEGYRAFRDFYGAAGAAVPLSDAGFGDLSAGCLEDGRCTGLKVVPDGYEPGVLSYRVAADRQMDVAFNESYYPGWTARMCAAAGDGECREGQPFRGPLGSLAVSVPEGSWLVTLAYRTPGLDVGMVGMWVGVGLAAVVGLGFWLRAGRGGGQAVRGPRAGGGA